MSLAPQATFRIFHAFTSMVFGLILAACSTMETPGELPTALSVDLSRYGGLWHEIARLPMWAQRNCVTSTAEYRLLESREVGVRNACVTNTGEEISIEGVATVVDSVHRAKLNVVFDQWGPSLWRSLPHRGEGIIGFFESTPSTSLRSSVPRIVITCESWHGPRRLMRQPIRTRSTLVNAWGLIPSV